ncbi:DUF3717 domain-containing protein [Massilia sp. X63]|uniref:DUF3717 domain-containing protein n=1 Tax=Massilia sp. X63 TaxID=3237285 RepID=UPI0034DD04DB
MALFVPIEELEATINKVRRVAPPVNGVLSPELRTLAEIYGVMIYASERSIDLDRLSESTRLTVVRCLALAGTTNRPIKPRTSTDLSAPCIDARAACQ